MLPKITINPLSKRILVILTIASASFFSYPYIGWAVATYDYKFRKTEYYFYGYIESDKAKFLKEKLREYNINANFEGCSVGGIEYDYKMMYNKVIQSNLPSDYFRNLKTEFDFIKSANDIKEYSK